MIRATIITIGVAFLAAVIAYAAAFLFDRFIGRVSLDTGFSVVFLAFISAVVVTPVILVRGRRSMRSSGR